MIMEDFGQEELYATAARLKSQATQIRLDSKRIATMAREIRYSLREQQERLRTSFDAIAERRAGRHAEP
ncbi:hypothetical protein [Nonomuraea monospora]